jgi:hypothetical protein
MSQYLGWNDALGAYFFHAGNAGKRVTLYLDRRRIEGIGSRHGLGGWEAFLAAAGTRVSSIPGLPFFGSLHPLTIAQHLCEIWSRRVGTVEGKDVDDLVFPPVFVGFALLVLAWTENEEQHHRSYYQRLARFIQSNFPETGDPERRLEELAFKSMMPALPVLAVWAKDAFESSCGELLLGKISQHQFVGAIRFHSLLDQDERDRLPSLWSKLHLTPGLPVPKDRLMELLMRLPHIEREVPILARLILRNPSGVKAHIQDLLTAEFEGWNGRSIAVIPKAKPVTTPILFIRLDDGKPQRVCIEWKDALGELTGMGARFYLETAPRSTSGILKNAETGHFVVPDATWLFEEINLEAGPIKIHRPKRNHFWAWPARLLGRGGSGFSESPQFMTDAKFSLVLTGLAVHTAEQWLGSFDAASSVSRQSLEQGALVIHGDSPRYNPFKKRAATQERPRIKLCQACPTIGETYRPELPVQVEVLAWQEGYVVQCECVEDPLIALKLQITGDGFYELVVPSWLEDKALIISLEDLHAQILDQVELRFQARSPLHQPNLPILEGLDRYGEWAQPSSYRPDRLFLNNHFWGGDAAGPSIQDRLLVPITPTPYAPHQSTALDEIMLAMSQPDGMLPYALFKKCARNVAGQHRLPEPKDTEIAELRREMVSLGFFHYRYENSNLHLAPLTFALLPDNFCHVRALLLGPLAASLNTFLQVWSNTADNKIRFVWLYQHNPLIPPILMLEAAALFDISRLADAIRVHFPGSVAPIERQSLPEAIMRWLSPIPRMRDLAFGDKADWTSFAPHQERWDPYRCEFVTPMQAPRFPLLTRSRGTYGKWTYYWWSDETHGYEVSHNSAIPYQHQLHKLPFIVQNHLKTDEILFPGRHRLPDLLERALVLATGQLPDRIEASQIPAFSKIFHPKAVFRRFRGIKPQMRQQLKRIYHNYISSELPQPFTPIEI